MGTKNNPSKFDCYANAGPDEPLFVLLARDKHAPLLVSLWCRLRELDGEDPGVVAEARQCATDMIMWQLAAGKRTDSRADIIVDALLEIMSQMEPKR